MKKQIIITAGLVILALGIGILCKVNIKAKKNTEVKERTSQEEMLYQVSKKAKVNDENLYDDVSEILERTTGEDKNKAKSRLKKSEEGRKELLKKAQKAGIKVSAKEVDREIEETKKALHEDAEGYAQLKAVLEGSNMTESEYWKKMRQFYKKSIMINQYLETQNGNASTDHSKQTVFGNAEWECFDRLFKVYSIWKRRTKNLRQIVQNRQKVRLADGLENDFLSKYQGKKEDLS